MEWRSDELESVPCDLCGNTPSGHIFNRADGLIVVECDSCGLCFVSPRPKPELIYRLYDKDYFKKQSPSPSSDVGFANYTSDLNREGMLRASQRRFNLFSRTTNIQPHRCLEIGCATGEFCQTLSQIGISIVGIDISEFAIAEAKTRYPRLDFRNGDIETLASDECFDVIFAYEVIEHVLSPRVFLKSARQHLEKDGILIITTPNYECGKTVGLDRWSGFSQSFEHLYFFTSAILTRYAHEESFSVEGWLTGGGNGIPRPESYARQFIRDLLNKAQLLDFVKTLRHKLSHETHDYQRGGRSHNLYMILRAC